MMSDYKFTYALVVYPKKKKKKNSEYCPWPMITHHLHRIYQALAIIRYLSPRSAQIL